MPASDVRFFNSTMSGAPVVNGNANTVANMLKICLTEGFGSRNVISLTVDATGLATVETSVAHGFVRWAVIRIEGAEPTWLNDDWQILSVDGTFFTFQADQAGALSATGTITAKMAPTKDWIVQSHVGNNIALKSMAPDASGKTFVVEDTGEDHYTNTSPGDLRSRFGGWCSIVENFVDFTSPKIGRSGFLVAGGGRPKTLWWSLVVDRRMLYFSINIRSGANAGSDTGQTLIYVFGDVESLREDDTNDVIIVNAGAANWRTNLNTSSGYWYSGLNLGSLFAFLTSGEGKRWVRNWNGETTAAGLAMFGSGVTSFTGYGGFNYPNPATGEALLSDIWCRDTTDGCLRGRLPGAKQVLHSAPVGSNSAVVTRIAPDGTVYLVLRASCGFDGTVNTTNTTNQHGEVWFKINGAWR
jgi:hypothetical protein